MKKPQIPQEVMNEIDREEPEPIKEEPESIKKTVTLIQDIKHTKQFSIRIPHDIIVLIKWRAGDRIDIEIEDDGLKLKKAKSD